MRRVTIPKIVVHGLAASLLLLPIPAAAALQLLTTQTSDAAYEGVGGWLDSNFVGLAVSGSGTSATVLPNLERAVAENRVGRANGSERTRGFHVPQAATGIPGVANANAGPTVPATGVFQALTNAGSLAPSNVTTAWVSGQAVAWQLGRSGNTLFYNVGLIGPALWQHSWSDTQSYYGDVNALQVRVRSAAPGTPSPASNGITLSGLTYDDATSGTELLGDASAVDGGVLIKLWRGVAGDFVLRGSTTMTFGAQRPGASALSSQIKLLVLPSVVPEPSSWTLFILGFGVIGVSLRRARSVATVS